jgi:hypothetical protein
MWAGRKISSAQNIRHNALRIDIGTGDIFSSQRLIFAAAGYPAAC